MVHLFPLCCLCDLRVNSIKMYSFIFRENKQKREKKKNAVGKIIGLLLEHTRTLAHARTRTRGNSNPELTTQSHCTSVRVSVDDKWRASQSKPICTSIRRGAKWGSTCIFLPAEKPYISAKTLPRGDGIRGRQRGEGEGGVTRGGGPIQLKYLGE